MDNDLIAKWREFYRTHADDESLEDSDFRDLAAGFFIALGATPEEAFELYEECIEMGMA